MLASRRCLRDTVDISKLMCGSLLRLWLTPMMDQCWFALRRQVAGVFFCSTGVMCNADNPTEPPATVVSHASFSRVFAAVIHSVVPH